MLLCIKYSSSLFYLFGVYWQHIKVIKNDNALVLTAGAHISNQPVRMSAGKHNSLTVALIMLRMSSTKWCTDGYACGKIAHTMKEMKIVYSCCCFLIKLGVYTELYTKTKRKKEKKTNQFFQYEMEQVHLKASLSNINLLHKGEIFKTQIKYHYGYLLIRNKWCFSWNIFVFLDKSCYEIKRWWKR